MSGLLAFELLQLTVFPGAATLIFVKAPNPKASEIAISAVKLSWGYR